MLLAPSHAARLLLVASRRVRMRAAGEFDEQKHQRDDHGRFTDGGDLGHPLNQTEGEARDQYAERMAAHAKAQAVKKGLSADLADSVGDSVNDWVLNATETVSGRRVEAIVADSIKRHKGIKTLGDALGHEFHGNQWTEQGVVTDKNGEPLTVYHGSVSRDVTATTLDASKEAVRPRPGQLNGIYFTSNAQTAQGYTRPPRSKLSVPPGRVIAANLVMKNPLDVTKAIKQGQKAGLSFGDAKREALKAVTKEHDGVIFRGDRYNSDEYMVFHGSQVQEPVKTRAAAGHKETAVHAAADEHLAQLSVAMRYAFAMGRKALGKSPANAAKAAAAVKAALLDVMPSALLKPLAAGGQVAIDELPRLKAASHKYASTQVNLPAELAAAIVAFGRTLIPDEDLAADGRELDQHVTVKYGIVDQDVAALLAALSDEGPATVTLGNTASFLSVENGTADAVTIAVESEDLQRLNQKIADAVESINSQAYYQPHVTIAYVKPGLGQKYAGNATFAGRKVTFDNVVLSGKDDEVVDLPLGLKALGDVEGHEFHGNQWTEGEGGTLYHGTSKERAAKILKEGLQISKAGETHPDFSGSGKSYLATTKEEARYWAEFGHGKNAAVLAVNIPKESAHIIEPDSNYTFKGRDGKLFKNEDKKIATKDISSHWIRALGLRSAAGPLIMKFDVSNPAAVAWAKEHAAELAVGISDTTERAIQDAVAQALEDGEDPADAIEAAVGDPARADLIARTEVMTAANEGQRQAWDQATEAGLLTGNEQVVWIATDDACPECDALDGETRDLDGEYPGDGGDGPPLHPNCRCTEGIQ